MSNNTLNQIVSIFGPTFKYKNAVPIIKRNGGLIFKVDENRVTFKFKDQTILTITNA